MKHILIGLIVLIVLFLLLLLQRRLTMPEPTGLGVQSGRLAACPDTPNCVSSFAEDERHHVDSLALVGDPAAALARLRAILEAMPRTVVVDAGDNYLHAEATSLIYRYVDDLEILIDPDAGRIHLRSASRAGYSDLGANRRRVRAVAEAYGRP
jgi:uncharacterized protein (DUF1499 family)